MSINTKGKSRSIKSPVKFKEVLKNTIIKYRIGGNGDGGAIVQLEILRLSLKLPKVRGVYYASLHDRDS